LSSTQLPDSTRLHVVGNYSDFNGGSIRVTLWSSNSVPGTLLLQTDGTRESIANTSLFTLPWVGFTSTPVFGKGAGDACLGNSDCQSGFLCVGSFGIEGSVSYCSPPCQEVNDCIPMVNTYNYNLNLPESLRRCNRWNTNILERGVFCVTPDQWPAFAGPNPGQPHCAFSCPEFSALGFDQQDQPESCGCLPGYFGTSTARLNFTCRVDKSVDCSLIQPCFAVPNPPIASCDISACNLDCATLEGTCKRVAVQGCNPSTPVICETCNTDCLIEFYPHENPTTVANNNFQFPNPLAAGLSCCNNCTVTPSA